MKPESEWYAAPPGKDGSEDQSGSEDAGKDTEPRETSLQMEQGEYAGRCHHSDVWTKAVREPNESVTTIDQLFADIIKDVERTGAEEGHAAEGCIRMPGGARVQCDNDEPQTGQRAPGKEPDSKARKAIVGSA